MSGEEIELQGRLREDEPPGRAAARPVVDYVQTEIWQFFERMYAERKAKGIPPTSQEEIDEYVATMRDEDDPRAGWSPREPVPSQ